MSKSNKVLLSMLVIGVLSGLSALGVFGLFTATTQNAGNEISAGTVAISDNDSGSALYSITGAKPGDTVTKCIKATFSGTLPSHVRLYTTSTAGPLAPYLALTITKGTQASSTFPDCSGFVPDLSGTTVYSGTLQAFGQASTSFATGIDVDPDGQTTWHTGNSLVFRFQATLQSNTPDSGQGASSGVHAFVWEAQND
jgi:hypothetical protein